MCSNICVCSKFQFGLSFEIPINRVDIYSQIKTIFLCSILSLFSFFFFSLSQFSRSFVPPARDEESETQRKAHAKRVRETRRSTQGVTLEEIKSAEELVKKKNQNNNNNVSTMCTASLLASAFAFRLTTVHSIIELQF